ncbi:uncharacterized protein LAESUDRAFT_714911 [Laetiporus sulphureus 93-53]|uniref:Uncharacterized protein n=1 Tax=Laetiporus sulphureus 93-53 TaxID=1314785 RepID=A0A165DPT5_9APHY|nr:uncharacterized protein LAESUDRAFT_714911 [Laetiporus sulphureus 93-53]KZT05362.1 hypothetical protein LAESUDRAFT_714911 [Laetiporus sulphureus 93-53]
MSKASLVRVMVTIDDVLSGLRRGGCDGERPSVRCFFGRSWRRGLGGVLGQDSFRHSACRTVSRDSWIAGVIVLTKRMIVKDRSALCGLLVCDTRRSVDPTGFHSTSISAAGIALESQLGKQPALESKSRNSRSGCLRHRHVGSVDKLDDDPSESKVDDDMPEMGWPALRPISIFWKLVATSRSGDVFDGWLWLPGPWQDWQDPATTHEARVLAFSGLARPCALRSAQAAILGRLNGGPICSERRAAEGGSDSSYLIRASESELALRLARLVTQPAAQ